MSEPFDGFPNAVADGITLVKQKHQDVSLVKVKGVTWSGQPTRDSRSIRNLTAFLNVAGNKSVRLDRKRGIEAKGQPDSWNSPVDLPNRVEGNWSIDWPVKVSLLEAYALKNLAGFDGPFQSVSLNPPVPRGGIETSYVFEGSSPVVIVGAVTGKVSTVP